LRDSINLDGRNIMTQVIEKPTFERQSAQDVDNNMAVAIYATHTEAEAAVTSLHKSGFDMQKLSIVGKDYRIDEHVVGFYNTGDRMKAWGATGAFWGGMWGLLFGAAFFVIPGVGPILMAGPIVSWIVGALEGAVVVGGLGALGAALVSAGIPKDSTLRYQTEISAGKFLLLVHGTKDEISRATALLELTNHLGMTSHPA
jgi:hypothetical protein